MNTATHCTNYAGSAYARLYPAHHQAVMAQAPVLRQFFPEAPQSILVAACGTGLDIASFAQTGWETSYSGFDLLPEMVSTARAELATKGIPADVWQGDLMVPGFGQEGLAQFELVVFRGSSVSHFSPADRPRLFANLAESVKSGGHLFFDFRDGAQYFMSEPSVEPLGSGYDARERAYYSAFYAREPSTSFDQPYTLTGVTTIVDHAGKVEVRSGKMQGYYIDTDETLGFCRQAGFTSIEEVTDQVGQSLRTLRSFVARKD